MNILDRVFEAADVDTCVVTLAKSHPTALRLGQMKSGKIVSETNTPTEAITAPDYIIQISLLNDRDGSAILKKMESRSLPLEQYATVSTGLKVYQIGKGNPRQTDKQKRERVFHARNKKNASYGRYLDGIDVGRYHLGWSGEWLAYGDWIAEPRHSVPFTGPRILVRQIPAAAPYHISAVLTKESFYNDINSMVVFSSKTLTPEFLLGVLNSRLISYWFQKKFDKFQRKIFPQFKVNELAAFPIVALDLKIPAEKIKHDRLVALVDKMLTLTPAARTAKSDKERAALQNALTKTDRDIDQLVYQLYELTPQEIALVERGDTATAVPNRGDRQAQTLLLGKN